MKNIIAITAIFLAGLLAGMTFGIFQDVTEVAKPQGISELVPQVLAQAPIPRESPADRVDESQIKVYSTQVILDIENAQWSRFTDTHSMEPVISVGANAIQVVPTQSEELKVGDIISYESEYADGIFIHRIIAINKDEDGWYATVKGDNNPGADPGRIRFSQVRRVLIAIVY